MTPPPPPPDDPTALTVAASDAGWFVWSWRLRSEAYLSRLCDCSFGGAEAADPSLATFRSRWDQAVDRLFASLFRGLSGDRGLALLFRPPGS